MAITKEVGETLFRTRTLQTLRWNVSPKNRIENTPLFPNHSVDGGPR
jgi:hypothetical protein